jgi:hypothetical protein
MRVSNKFDYFVNNYFSTQRIEIIPYCNGITFTNLGDTTITVDGMVLYPGTIGSIIGDSRTIGGNEGEILAKKQITITFPVGGLNPNLEVIQKIYV